MSISPIDALYSRPIHRLFKSIPRHFLILIFTVNDQQIPAMKYADSEKGSLASTSTNSLKRNYDAFLTKSTKLGLEVRGIQPVTEEVSGGKRLEQF